MKRRNASLTCIAPTGTLSMLAGCSSGIEPVFSLEQKRFVSHRGGRREITMLNVPYAEALEEGLPESEIARVFRTAREIKPYHHVAMQAVFQRHTDLAVSKTVNLPSSASVQDVEDALLQAWGSECKGITVYRDGSRSEQVLAPAKPDERTSASRTRLPTVGPSVDEKTECAS